MNPPHDIPLQSGTSLLVNKFLHKPVSWTIHTSPDNTTMQSLPYLISSSAPLKLFCQAAEYKFHKYSTPIKKNLLCFLIHT